MGRALVLSGGGSKGAYEAGALGHFMGALGLDYDLVCGISVGAINAAFLAQTPLGKPLEAVAALHAMWGTVTTAKVHKRWFPFGRVSALWRRSVYDSWPVQQWIRSGLDETKIKASGRKLRIVATSFTSGEPRVITEQDSQLAEWVIGSSAFPVMLTPIQVGNERWTDGGLHSVTPLGEAIRAGATEIDMILCSAPFAKSPMDDSKASAIPDYLLRSIDIMSTEISRQDLRTALDRNDLADLKPEMKYRKVKIRVLEPKTPLPFNSLDFSPENIKEMMDLGRDDAAMLEAAGVTS